MLYRQPAQQNSEEQKYPGRIEQRPPREVAEEKSQAVEITLSCILIGVNERKSKILKFLFLTESQGNIIMHELHSWYILHGNLV